jgi:hypothetical protein
MPNANLTTADILQDGQYLEPSFNPATLTVSQLQGLLWYHEISTPGRGTKPALVAVFNERLVPRRAELKLERAKAASAKPSSAGIVDGITGRPVDQEL